MNLTGKSRFRTGRNWWGKQIIILQVQFTYTKTYMNGPVPELSTVYEWRDAKLTDLRIRELFK